MLLDMVRAQAALHSDTREGPAFRFEGMDLTEIPEELIDALVAHKPSKVSFQNNSLTTLPANLRQLQSLYYLDVSGNSFEALPLVVCDLGHLEILDLSMNSLQRLPLELAKLGSLQVLSLKNNSIEYVPPVLADVANLSFVELDQNPLIMPQQDEPNKNDPEWLAEYIKIHRPMLESRQTRLRSISDGRKRMGFVMDESAASISTPTSPRSPALQPSPIQQSHQDVAGDRLLFALRQFLKGFDGLGRPALVVTGQQLYVTASVRITELGNAVDAGVRYEPHCSRAIEAVLNLVKPLQTWCAQLCTEADICAIRALILTTFHSINELNNAWSALAPQATTEISSAFAAADELLYNQLESATVSSKAVLSLLNDTVSRSALASVDTDPAVPAERFASKVKELSNACISGFAATRRLSLAMEKRASLGTVPDREKFWKAVNDFLKSIIAILGAAKLAMDELPLLAEVRSQISTLARVAKEIPPLLEQSSFKLAMSDNVSPRQTQFPLTAPKINTGMHAPFITGTSPGMQPPTPLTASLGNAAQAVMSPGVHQQASPFFHDFRG